jgi:hypothetical protein
MLSQKEKCCKRLIFDFVKAAAKVTSKTNGRAIINTTPELPSSNKKTADKPLKVF